MSRLLQESAIADAEEKVGGGGGRGGGGDGGDDETPVAATAGASWRQKVFGSWSRCSASAASS